MMLNIQGEMNNQKVKSLVLDKHKALRMLSSKYVQKKGEMVGI
jgi:hypothetical protein